MISKEKKQAIINEYARTPGDTGSPEVQIAILTARIQEPHRLQYPERDVSRIEKKALEKLRIEYEKP